MDTDTELQNLLAEVDHYLAETGIGPSAFGKLVLRDGNVISRMREGKSLTTKTVSAIRRFMTENPPKSSGEETAA